MLSKFVKGVQRRLRRLLWQILGVSWPNANWIFRRQYLSNATWVERGVYSYDNGALVWRWSRNEKLLIGKYCSIAFGVQFLCGSGHHRKDAVSTFPLMRHVFIPGEMVNIAGVKKTRADWDELMAVSKGPIIVGNDVWIGQNAMILSGVTIGHGAIVLAGSIVTKNVEPYAIVGGTPARFIEYRFTPEIIQSLLNIAWWDWPESCIKERMTDFYDINTFVMKYNSNEKQELH